MYITSVTIFLRTHCYQNVEITKMKSCRDVVLAGRDHHIASIFLLLDISFIRFLNCQEFRAQGFDLYREFVPREVKSCRQGLCYQTLEICLPLFSAEGAPDMPPDSFQYFWFIGLPQFCKYIVVWMLVGCQPGWPFKVLKTN